MNSTCFSDSVGVRATASLTGDEHLSGNVNGAQPSLTASQTLQGLLTPDLRSINRAPSQPYELLLAEVSGVDEEGYVVVNLQTGRRIKVQVAVGCLLEPERGDLVQVFGNRLGGWITMVLRRTSENSPVTLNAGGRNIRVQAPSLSLAATDRVTVEADRIEQRATLMETVVQERACAVLGGDNLQAGSANWNVESHLGVHSSTQLMTADGLMKINAGQIHMA